jgi:hypothetical protein
MLVTRKEEKDCIVEITGKDKQGFHIAHFLNTLEILPTNNNKFSKYYVNGYVSKQCECPVEIGKKYRVLEYSVSLLVCIHQLEPYSE